MKRSLMRSVLWLAASLAFSGGAQDSQKIYSLTEGSVSWPASGFSARTGTKDANWIIIPGEGELQNFSSMRGIEGSILQLQTARKVHTVDAVLDYHVQIDQPGIYEIRFRASGHDKTADSAWIRIKELGDEYVQIGGVASSLRDIRWRTVEKLFEVKTPGVYTIQIGNREDGYCILELEIRKVSALPEGILG